MPMPAALRPTHSLPLVTAQRLKDKLGDRSNASSEVEYRNAWGIMVGEEGAGIKTIMDMVMRTRLDCAVGSAALMRFAVTNVRLRLPSCAPRAAALLKHCVRRTVRR